MKVVHPPTVRMEGPDLDGIFTLYVRRDCIDAGGRWAPQHAVAKADGGVVWKRHEQGGKMTPLYEGRDADEAKRRMDLAKETP